MNSPTKNDDAGARRIPEEFPDRQTCRVRRSILDGYFDCVSLWGARCSYCLMIGEQRFCRHPEASLMLDKSV